MSIIAGSDVLKLFPKFRLVNREEDLERIAAILSRKRNNSLLLVSPGGAGASSILLGLQHSKESNNASFDILTKNFFWLDIDKLFSNGDGQSINDEFQKTLRQLEATPNSVLIINDAHTFLEGARNSGNSHFINALNNADKSQSFQVIMEVKDEQLTDVIKANNSISNLYTMYDVKEPTGQHLFDVVREVANNLSEFHGIEIDDSAIEESIHLCSKYRDSLGLGGAQPRRAISLLDRAVSAYKQSINKNHPKIVELQKQLDKATTKDEKLELSEMLEDTINDWNDMKEEIAYIYAQQTKGETLRFNLKEELKLIESEEEARRGKSGSKPIGGLDSTAVREIKDKISQVDKELLINKQKYEQLLKTANKGLILSKKDVILEFSKISGISASKLDENELEILRNLESNILERIFGQDGVVNHVANGIKVSKIDTMEESGPAAAFLFLGPSGTGKTELSKTLAKELYGDEKALVRFDMSEYMEKHAVAKLIGAPPGYEGFEAGGILTNTVRRNPVGIYLFDEIEKANDEVYNVFLQILSDGRLTDNVGRTVDFSEIIIIMTSNIGQKFYLDDTLSDEEAVEEATKELKSRYKPELLNRFNGCQNILHFKRLPLSVIEKIVQREIVRLNKSYKPRNIRINLNNECIGLFCKDHYKVETGARGLPGHIKSNLRPIIVNHLLDNPNDTGVFNITYDVDKKVFKVVFEKDK